MRRPRALPLTLSVWPHLEPVDDACGQRNDVLQRPGHLGTLNVGDDANAEGPTPERGLKKASSALSDTDETFIIAAILAMRHPRSIRSTRKNKTVHRAYGGHHALVREGG